MPRQASASAQSRRGHWSYLFISLLFIVVVLIIKAISFRWEQALLELLHSSCVSNPEVTSIQTVCSDKRENENKDVFFLVKGKGTNLFFTVWL